MFALLTLKLGFSPDYVLDEMQVYEINAIMQYSYLKDQESWEQARLIAYVVAQVQSHKKMKPTDILKFPWDGKELGETQTPTITNDDIARLQERAAMYASIINNSND